MERALVIVAALGLACSVSVEGAPCGAPGTTVDCPSGQACGNDGTCSERAAACTAPQARCTVGEKRCGGAGGTGAVERCSGDSDPVCGAWVVEDACGAGLACGTRSAGGAPDCECQGGFAGPEFAADPDDGSLPGAFPFPTGAASPKQCRFKRLGDAIAAAAQVLASGQVRAYGRGAQVVFGDGASGDGPIAIPASVTVVAASAPAAGTTFRWETPTTAPLVTLGGRLEGFRIENVGATGAGIAAACGASGKPSLADVTVDGGGALTTGIDVSGACGADLAGVSVSYAAAATNVAGSGAALSVHADPAAEVTVHGGSFGSSDVGVRLTGGKVTLGAAGDPLGAVEIAGNARDGVAASGGAALDARLHFANVHGNGGAALSVADASTLVTVYGGTLGGSDVGAKLTGGSVTLGADGDSQGAVEVAGNAKHGIVASSGASVTAAVYGAKVHGNAGAGLVVNRVSAGSALTVRGCDIHSNGTAGSDTYAGGRAVGGVLVVQGTLPFTFLANRVYANTGDQLAIESADTGWSLAPTSCADSNVFGCSVATPPPPGCADGACAIAVAAGGRIDATNTVWPYFPNEDYANGNVTGLASYCNGKTGAPSLPACPSP